MAAIRSFVKIKPTAVKSPVGRNLQELRKGINRTGVLVQGIGVNLDQTRKLIEFEREFLKTNTQEQILEVKSEQKEKLTFGAKMKRFGRKLFQKKKRDDSEDQAERGVDDAKEDKKKAAEKVKKPVKSFLQALGGILGTVAKYFIMFGVLDAMEKNPEAFVKVFKLAYNIGKFAFNLAKFGVGGIMDGLTNLFGDFSDLNEGIVKRGLRFILGAFQVLGGFAALRAAQYILMPWKLMQDINWVKGVFSGSKQAGVDPNARPSRGVRSSNASKEARKRYARRYGGDAAKNRFQSRVPGRQAFKGSTTLGRAGRGMMSMKGMGALSVLGGGLRIASGLQSGEGAGTAVGAGVGQAVGGIAGAAALTAVAPWLGPLAPLIGNAVGGFLGEWVGKSIGPIIEPIMGPIGEYFKMMFDIIKDVGGELLKPFQELFGALFEFLQPLFGLIGEGFKILTDFTKFILGGAINVIGKTIQFVISNAKRLMNPASVGAGFLDALTFGLTDFDKMGRAAGGMVGTPLPATHPKGATDKLKAELLEVVTNKDDRSLRGIIIKAARVMKQALGIRDEKVKQQSYGSSSSSGAGQRPSTASGAGPSSGGAPSVSGDFDEKFAAVLGSYEGLRLEAYADANYGWEIPTIGIGATYYPPGFRLSGKVKRGDTITEEEAYWIKSKHIEDHRKRLVGEVGSDLYNKASERQKVGLESVVFNYGSLDGAGIKSVVRTALETGDFSPVIAAYRDRLANHNGGINSWRRNDEASIMEKGVGTRVPSIQFAAEGGKIIQDVPYINQRANKADKYGRPGDTQCYSTTMAMWVAQLTGKPMTAEDYNKVRSGYGISTEAYPQKKALADFGINSSLQTGQSWETLRNEIKAGYPVPVGFKYKGSGHWGMVVGMKDNGFVVHDPFGQLNYGGTWKKTNSAGNKTDGPGKYYFMDKNLFENQLPNGDVWMWKAPRSIKPSKKIGDVSTQGEGSSPQTGSSNASTPSGQTQDTTESKPQTLEQALDALTRTFETSFRDAFAKGIGMSGTGEASLRVGLSRARGQAAESAIKQRAMISQIAPEVTAGNLRSVQEKSKQQAKRKKDQEMTPEILPIVQQQTVVQHVINNQGGGPKVVWTKPSPMVAPF
jgi:GH24 family phage-related lysozyme (muramidase)